MPTSENVKRPYRSPVREESARRTRAAIRAAARAEFLQVGYVSTTVRRVAAAAGVAERTLYAAYPSKLDLFRAVLDDAAVGGQQQVTAADVPEFRAAVEAADAGRAAAAVAAVAAQLLERTGALIATMLESSGADEEVRRLADGGFRQSREDAGRVTAALADAGLLRPGLDAATAADELHALCSPQVHRILRAGHGWDEERYRGWLEDARRPPAPGRPRDGRGSLSATPVRRRAATTLQRCPAPSLRTAAPSSAPHPRRTVPKGSAAAAPLPRPSQLRLA
jgi:AcrR family transcriptional regulator